MLPVTILFTSFACIGIILKYANYRSLCLQSCPYSALARSPVSCKLSSLTPFDWHTDRLHVPQNENGNSCSREVFLPSHGGCLLAYLQLLIRSGFSRRSDVRQSTDIRPTTSMRMHNPLYGRGTLYSVVCPIPW